jgi:hypothetical protein
LDGEGKKEVAELLSSSVEAGAVRNGAAKRQPWRCLQVTGRRARKEEERAREKKKGGGGLSRGVQGLLQGVF